MVIKISLCVIVFLLLCFIIQIECLTVIPSRANVTFKNTKYVSSATCNIRRYGRKSPYYMNIIGNTKHTWGNNVTTHIIVKQLLTNVYRRSFVDFHYKFCDLVNGEPFMGTMLKAAGVVCPLPAGDHYFMNMTIHTAGFVNVFPFEKGRADVSVTLTETGEPIVECYFEVEFKQKP